MTPRALAAALQVLLLVGLAAGTARAQSDDKAREQEARQYFDAGKQAAQKGQYQIAIVAFEEAYKRAPRASVVFALAYSYRQQWIIDRDPAKLRRAVKLLRDYLDLPGNDKRDKAVEYLGELEPELAKIDAAGPATPEPPVAPPARTTLVVSSPVEGALVEFDGGAAQETPAVIDTSTGRHKLRVTAPGWMPAERDAVAVEGQVISVEVPLEPRPATLTVNGPAGAKVAVDGKVVGATGQPLSMPAGRRRITVVKRGRYAWERDLVLERGASLTVEAQLPVTTQRDIAWYFLGGGAALALAGGAAGLVTLDLQGSAEDVNARVAGGDVLNEGERVDYNDTIDRRDRWRGITYGLLGVGAAALATGAVLYFIDTPRLEGPAPEAPAITPVVGAGSVGLSWQGRF